mmetsp:Transcript_5319/g.8976  ORF Transcript_5319/g.8976 Transcript_5319/m.8976 type:complete len:343 (+) Transcript_5319:148-1176(+)
MSSQQPKKGGDTHQVQVDVPSPNKKQIRKRERWSSGSYPYPTDYNDHFETPQRAYEDIYPLLQYCLQKNKKSNNNVIYDPYFCTGTAAILMEQTFKSNKHKSPLPTSVRIHHKKADFYEDIRQNKVPQYDILVTNPPYSSNHKERCLEFAVNQLKRNGRPFFLLMPNYVSTKDYFRRITQTIQVVFIAPSTSHPYEYNHPEGTGHEKSPFESVWFCGVSGNEDMKALKEKFIKFHSKHTSTPIPRWAESLQGLIKVGGVSGEKRKNPRQRKKMRLLAMQKSSSGDAAAASGPPSSTPVKKNAALSSGGQKKDGKPNKNDKRRKQNSAKKAKKRRLNDGNDKS